MEIDLYHGIRHESVIGPRKWKRYENGYVSSWREIHEDLNVIGVTCMEITPVCIDSGDYWNPPIYDMEPVTILEIKPIMKCWGRGLDLCNN